MSEHTPGVGDDPARDAGVTDGASPIGERAVRRQADVILSSDRFTRSRRGSALLRYVVDETLAGRGAGISATTIAQDVLGKSDDFDSGADPLVRVQMGRMRALLASWYDDHADEAEVCIRIPKGTYEPVFEPMAPSGADAEAPADDADPDPASIPVARRPRLRPGHAVAAALVAALGGILWLAAGAGMPKTPASYPVVVVEPFENLTGIAENEPLTRGLQRQLAADLQRFRTVRVALAGSAQEGSPMPRGARGARMAARSRARALGDYAVSGTILSAADELDFTVDLIDLATGTLIDRRRLRSEAGGDYHAVLSELSLAATGSIVGGGGALDRAARTDETITMPANGSLPTFRCLVLFDEFTRAKTPEGAKIAHDCLTEQAAARPRDAGVLAALAWTRAMVAPDAGQVEAGDWASGYDLAGALALAERAVALGPGDDFAHEHLGLLQWRGGQPRAAIGSVRRAMDLNPGNPHLSADLALLLALEGRWDEALAMSDRAYARSGDPPGWYALPRYYRALTGGDANEAVRLSDIVAEGDPYGSVYRLAAAALAGDEAAVARLRPEVAAAAERQDGDPLRDARPWIRSGEVLDALESLLVRAGVEVTTA